MPTITSRFAERAPQGRHYDGRLPGFGIYIGATKKSYFVEYRDGHGRGSRVRRFTFAEHGGPAPDGRAWTAERARREAMRLLGLIRAGEDPLAERERRKTESRRRGFTVAEVADEWLARDQVGYRSLKEHRRIVTRYILPEIGHLPIEEVRRADLLRFLERIADRAPVMANRTFARLRRLFRWALARELVERDPTAGLEPPAREKSRDRVLGDDELATVWKAAERTGFPYGHIIRLLILTGCRREEIGALRWSEVRDLDGAEPRIELAGDRTKTGEPRIVPLSGPAAAILRDCPRFTGPQVFGVGGRGSFQGWSWAKRRLDVMVAALAGAPFEEDWRVHDLRRTCATGLQRLGVRLEVTEAVLGHVSGSRSGIVGVYQRHRYEPEKRQALHAWARNVTELVEGGNGAPLVPSIRR
ncbi:MAG TPA: DUF4102 domain-containing protein [Rhodospirillales bacterium]|nr:DUF4102 domain-containing protein [Rhodospirillales bacterium]